jgi:excisionase family DNA binding protein
MINMNVPMQAPGEEAMAEMGAPKGLADRGAEAAGAVSVARAEPRFISTRAAAARLGVAVSTVQGWVETGVLPAWKTAGGHRRIPEQAIDAMELRQEAVLATAPVDRPYKVLVVEDDPVQRELYRRQFAEWGLPVQLLTAEDGYEGLLLIGRHNPDLVITDLSMPGMDGFRMLRRLRDLPSAIRASIIVVTGLAREEIEAAGGVPAGIPVYPKPIPFAALRPVVTHLARKLAAQE